MKLWNKLTELTITRKLRMLADAVIDVNGTEVDLMQIAASTELAALNDLTTDTNLLDLNSRTALLEQRASNLEAITGVTQVNTAGVIQFANATQSENESTIFTVRVIRTGGSVGTVTAVVNYTGTATPTSEYTTNLAEGASVSMGEGVLFQDITITALDLASAKTVILTMSGHSPAASAGAFNQACTVSIAATASASAGTISLSASTFSIAEPSSAASPDPVTITAIRSGGSVGAVTATGTLTSSTALPGTDYTTKTLTFSWADGVSGAATDTINILNNDLNQSNTSFNIALNQPSAGAALGAQSTASVNITNTAPVSGTPLFRDRFNYVVDITDSYSVGFAAFQAAGWAWAKAKNAASDLANSNGALGYIYTAATIPGYVGSFPDASNRALCLNAEPVSLGDGNPLNPDNQTDFYLQLGAETAPNTTIPGDVWFQCWLYPCRSGAQMSVFAAKNKLFYPSWAGAFSGTLHKWLTEMGTSENPAASPETGGLMLRTADSGSNSLSNTVVVTPNDGSDFQRTCRGQNNSVAEYLRVNRWTLVKIHYDTSTTSGKYECWMRALGTPTFTKVAEWIDGVTSGFTWTINSGYIGGHACMRFPTTIPGARNPVPHYPSWLYMQDFVMSDTEAKLPTSW